MPMPGPFELIVILVIALLILGPGKLPDVGSALGKSIREFRKASSDIQDATRVDTSPLPPSATPSAAAPPPASTEPTAEPKH
jgi:sec-independent protein translocase protein TatA